MKTAAIVLAALSLAACQSLPADPAKMSAEQLKAWASDKNASAACVSGKTAAGNVTTTYAVLDKGAVASGALTIDADCKVTITALPRAASGPQ